MAITLTESRLRQIIREEVRLLGRKPRRSIKESAKLVPSVRAMSSAKRVLRKFGVPLDSTGLDRVFNVVLDYGPFKDAAAFKSQLKQSLDTDTLSDLRGEGRSTDEFFAAFLGAFQTDRLPEGRTSAWDSSGAAADAMESILALARNSDFYDNRPTKENAMAIVDEVCDDLGSACPMSFRMEAVKQLMDNAGGVAAGWSEFAKKGY